MYLKITGLLCTVLLVLGACSPRSASKVSSISKDKETQQQGFRPADKSPETTYCAKLNISGHPDLTTAIFEQRIENQTKNFWVCFFDLKEKTVSGGSLEKQVSFFMQQEGITHSEAEQRAQEIFSLDFPLNEVEGATYLPDDIYKVLIVDIKKGEIFASRTAQMAVLE